MSGLRLAASSLMRTASLSASLTSRRAVATTAVLCKGPAMPDSLEHAVGYEKKEMLAKLAGNDDLFEMKLRARGEGSRENPDLVPSMFNKRIVGHICEEDQTYITWFWLYKGHPKRCRCGHWFKLIEADPL